MNPPADPYDPRPAFWQRRPDLTWAAAVFALTVLLTVVSFPPYKTPEIAYAFAAPAILWAYRRPGFRLFAWTLFAAQAVAWTIILAWLRHVNWVALLLLGPFVGAWVGSWYLAAWWAMPRMIGKAISTRLAAMLGLAGLWVLVEWTRTWFLGGFPWLPLAASQWERAGVLQLAAFTGAAGVSFVLVSFNIGFAAYMHRLVFEGPAAERRRNRELFTTEPLPDLGEVRDWGLRRRSQEFLLALFMLLVCLSIFLPEIANSRPYREHLARVAFVQPDIPQEAKWDPAKADGIIRTLRQVTLAAGASRPELILWPEAALPYPLNADPGVRGFAESVANDAGAPLFLGAVAVSGPRGPDEKWSDAAFAVEPGSGLQNAFYSKRHLVPFGEYIPLRPILGWLSKVVPIGGDFAPGTDATPIVVGLPRGAAALGPLICYEDLFPSLSRESVLSGADALVVVTNDAWYGEEGAAYQHAAHSVLRAVETRRPVLRCGNAGWSGWIDEYGGIRYVLTSGEGSVYFRGTGTINVTRDSRWTGKNSFYVQHGDWFVAVCAALVLFGYWALRPFRNRIAET